MLYLDRVLIELDPTQSPWILELYFHGRRIPLKMLEVRHVFSYLEFNNHSVIHFGKRQYGVWYPYLVFEYVIKTHKFNPTRFTIEDSPRRIEMKEEIMNQRIEHIESLENLVKSQTDNLSTIQTKSILEVIGILTFITNVEYTNLIKQSKKFDKDNFIVELTQFLTDDIHWKKISNKRKTEFEELKICYMNEEGRDFKMNEYIYMLEGIMRKSK